MNIISVSYTHLDVYKRQTYLYERVYYLAPPDGASEGQCMQVTCLIIVVDMQRAQAFSAERTDHGNRGECARTSQFGVADVEACAEISFIERVYVVHKLGFGGADRGRDMPVCESEHVFNGNNDSELLAICLLYTSTPVITTPARIIYQKN